MALETSCQMPFMLWVSTNPIMPSFVMLNVILLGVVASIFIALGEFSLQSKDS
jgi:hypothetical protein